MSRLLERSGKEILKDLAPFVGFVIFGLILSWWAGWSGSHSQWVELVKRVSEKIEGLDCLGHWVA